MDLGHPLKDGRRIGETGALRSCALIRRSSSTVNTGAPFGGFIQGPNRSRNYLTKSRPRITLKLVLLPTVRDRTSAKSRPRSCWGIPPVTPMLRVDQRPVSPVDADSNVPTASQVGATQVGVTQVGRTPPIGRVSSHMGLA
jgi:hypothetical protein